MPALSVFLALGAVSPLPVAAVLAAWQAAFRVPLAGMSLAWASVILIFLGGVRRGLSFRQAGGETPGQLASGLGLFALGVLSLAVTIGALSFDDRAERFLLAAAILLAGAYGVLFAVDHAAARRGEAPLHFKRLRLWQLLIAGPSFAALAGLVAAH